MAKAKARVKKSVAMRLLEELAGGPATFSEAIRTVRECDQLTLEAVSKRLGISRARTCATSRKDDEA